MIQPDLLADRMARCAALLADQGPLTWQRVHDWTTTGRMPAAGIRGGGLSDPDAGELDDRQAERAEDRKAARYQTELTALTTRLDADLARLRVIIGVACPDGPAAFATSDMLAAQVAADGWCVSCWRDDQALVPVTLRAGSQVPVWKDLCRWCGDWRAVHRALPPLRLVRLHRQGRRITTADVERELTR